MALHIHNNYCFQKGFVKETETEHALLADPLSHHQTTTKQPQKAHKHPQPQPDIKTTE